MVTDPKPWLQSYSPGMPSSLDYPRAPLYHFLQQSASRFIPTDQLSSTRTRRKGKNPSPSSYRELDDTSERFAAALVSLGVEKGDRVAYYIQNSPELIAGFYGILKAGAVPVPCNVMYQAEELAYHLNDSGAQTLLCEANLYPTAQSVLEETPVTNVIAAGGQVEGDVLHWEQAMAEAPRTE